MDLSYHANVQFTYEGYNSSSWIDHILIAATFPLAFPLFKILTLLLIFHITILSPVSLITQFVVLLIWSLLRSHNSSLVQPGIIVLMILTFNSSMLYF